MQMLHDPTHEAQRTRDGRNVAPDIGMLSGEGAQQRVKPPLQREEVPVPREPSPAIAAEEGPSYYGMPVLKEPVWKWMIPGYFFTGGLAGSCAVLGAAAQAVGGRGTETLIRRCRLVATGGAVASTALLIADLGRPARFLNMLRVFRPTSPMNMGTWILTPFGGLSALAALPALVRNPPRRLTSAANGAAIGAALLGLPLVGYTGVLIANTAVPVWQAARNTLPILFAFSGAVSAGSLFEMWPPGGAGQDMARRLSLLSKAAELGLSIALDREASATAPRVARPLQRGMSGAMLNAARLLVAASLAGELWGGRKRRRWRPGGRRWQTATLSGALGLAGTLLLRFGIIAAGRASARDPHATFEMQRRGHGAAEIARRREGVSMPSVPGVHAAEKASAKEIHGGPGV